LFKVEGSNYQWDTPLNGQRINVQAWLDSFWYRASTNGGSWSTNGTLVQSGASVPMLRDSDDFHPRPPKSAKNAVYMDGHAATFEMTGIAAR
jgi:hypothetical protein